MRRALCILLLVPAALSFTGCRKAGSAGAHEPVIQKVITGLQNAKATLDGITDAASSARAIQVFNDERVKIPSKQEWDNLAKPSADAKAKAKESFRELESSWKSFSQARTALGNRLGPGQLSKEFMAALNAYQFAVLDFLGMAATLAESKN